MTKRLNTNQKGKLGQSEVEDLDDADLDAIEGNGYDASDPNEWPEEVKAAARANWSEGPDAFDEWVANQEVDPTRPDLTRAEAARRLARQDYSPPSGTVALTAAATRKRVFRAERFTWNEDDVIVEDD